MQPFGGALGGLMWGTLAPYGSISLTATSPAQDFTEPITLAEMKEYLNLPARSPADDTEDAMINAMITAAREVAEVLQGRDLVRKQFDLYFDYFWKYQIECRDPLVSVDLVRYRSSDGSYTTLVEGTDYEVDTVKHPGLITPTYNTTWPSFTAWPSSAVLVRFTAGYASTDAFWNDAGQRILIGMKMLVSMWYNNRLPFDASRDVSEYPFAVTALLGFGARQSVR